MQKKPDPKESFEYQPLPERSGVPVALIVVGILVIGILSAVTAYQLISDQPGVRSASPDVASVSQVAPQSSSASNAPSASASQASSSSHASSNSPAPSGSQAAAASSSSSSDAEDKERARRAAEAEEQARRNAEERRKAVDAGKQVFEGVVRVTTYAERAAEFSPSIPSFANVDDQLVLLVFDQPTTFDAAYAGDMGAIRECTSDCLNIGDWWSRYEGQRVVVACPAADLVRPSDVGGILYGAVAKTPELLYVVDDAAGSEVG